MLFAIASDRADKKKKRKIKSSSSIYIYVCWHNPLARQTDRSCGHSKPISLLPVQRFSSSRISCWTRQNNKRKKKSTVLYLNWLDFWTEQCRATRTTDWPFSLWKHFRSRKSLLYWIIYKSLYGRASRAQNSFHFSPSNTPAIRRCAVAIYPNPTRTITTTRCWERENENTTIGQ